MADDGRSHRFLTARASPVFAFRVVLAGVMLSTTIGILYAVTNRAGFVTSFPGAAKTWLYLGFLMAAVGGLTALVGLWRWQRWALALYGIVVALSLVLDRLASAPMAHEMAVLAGAAAVLGLAYLNRRRFWAGA